MKKYQAVFVVVLAATAVLANAETTTTTNQNTSADSKPMNTEAPPANQTVANKAKKKKKKKPAAPQAQSTSQAPAAAPAAPVAATEQPVVTSQAAPIAVESSRTTVAPKFVDNLIVFDALYFYGPGINTIDSRYTPDGYHAKSDTPLTFENIATLGYRAIDDVAISANVNTLHMPTGAGTEKDTIFKDPYFRVKKSNVINNGGLNLALDGRFYAPVSQSSRKNEQTLSLRSTQYLKYTTGRWTLLSTTYARHYARGAETPVSWEFYAGPEVDFQITPTLSASMLYEMLTVHHKASNGFTSQFEEGAGTDLEPGLSWDITPSISFSPYLNINTGGRVSWDTTSINFLLTASIL